MTNDQEGFNPRASIMTRHGKKLITIKLFDEYFRTIDPDYVAFSREAEFEASPELSKEACRLMKIRMAAVSRLQNHVQGIASLPSITRAHQDIYEAAGGTDVRRVGEELFEEFLMTVDVSYRAHCLEDQFVKKPDLEVIAQHAKAICMAALCRLENHIRGLGFDGVPQAHASVFRLKASESAA